MNRIEALVKAWASHVAIPWASGLSGGEKVWFCVYDKADERRLRLHLPEFEGAAKKAGHGWESIELTDSFATWMAAEEYRDSFFEDPSHLTEAKLLDFREWLVALVSPRLERAGEADIVVLSGVSSLFGFVRVSELVGALEPSIRGRLVVFFPGVYENGNYRFLDAHDGWSYRAVPILASEGAFAS
ncbi:MAG: BREX protein BrxB domain-containing protein [Thermoanaerobaculia bacterium]